MRLFRVLLLALVIVGHGRSAQAQEPAHRTTQFHGFLFGDVVYVAREEGGNDGFVVGQIVGHGNARMSERVSLFAEASASARPTGYAFEIERAILRYDFADAFKLSVGRYHTPVSYWNTAYHHGLWLQTSVARPEIIKVGGEFIPVHFVGALAEGRITLGPAAISYDAGIGNGRGSLIARAGDAGDVNTARATLLAARIRPFDNGLQFGGSLYFDRIQSEVAAFDERITAAHIVWDRGAPELIAEFARVQHDPRAGGEAVHSDGWYAHAGYRLGGALYRFKPYVRYERLDSNELDPIFASALTDYRSGIAGVRYDFDALAAVKAEYRRERRGSADWLDALYLQVAFAVAPAGVL